MEKLLEVARSGKVKEPLLIPVEDCHTVTSIQIGAGPWNEVVITAMAKGARNHYIFGKNPDGNVENHRKNENPAKAQKRGSHYQHTGFSHFLIRFLSKCSQKPRFELLQMEHRSKGPIKQEV